MNDYRCKTPVTLIFFNRPNTFRKVFEKVREAKPYKLYLVQDGARLNRTDDVTRIQECRKIAENVDWECQVFKNYSDINLGCGMRPQSGITWTLDAEDSTIVLEDDCVPDLSFFRYCDELLEKYKNDTRVSYISGLNHFEEWDFGGNSYGFTKRGAIWGWATWRRAWNMYDYSVANIEDDYLQKQLKYVGMDRKVETWKQTNKLVVNGEQISYWDDQWGFVKHTQNQLVAVPKTNLICNIGTGEESTHARSLDNKHIKYVDYNNMPIESLMFPLKHPPYIICDKMYDDLVIKCNKRIKYRPQTIIRRFKSVARKLLSLQ